jgi:general secretion pathway protein B
MSFILDALKKLEKEKAARRQGDVNISNEILRPNHRTGRRAERAIPLRVAGVASAAFAVVLILAGGYYWHHKKGVANVAESKARDMGSNAQEETPKYAPPSPPPVAMPAQAPQAPPQPQVPAVVSPPVPQIPPMASAPKKSRNSVHSEPVAAFPPTSGGDLQGGAPSGSGNLSVSGIAWQDERKARRAVVNGQLIGEGTMIGGAKVVEIQQGQVRFSSGGRTFEVSVSGAQQGR